MSGILPSDHCEPGEFKISVDAEDPKNPRIRVNMPAGVALGEITEVPGNKPILVIVCRADLEIPALGLLEKMKLVVARYQAKHDKKMELSQGVANLSGLLDPKRFHA